jgi:tRNA pseudouridine55 synthase
VECSKGTYIRSLAHDLGQTLGCGASLKELVRSRCGIFKIESAVSLPQLEDACGHGYWQRFLYPVDSVLQDWKAIIASGATEDAIKKGAMVELPEMGGNEKSAQHEPYCRAYNLDGRFIAILRLVPETGHWHPDKVFL